MAPPEFIVFNHGNPVLIVSLDAKIGEMGSKKMTLIGMKISIANKDF
jgi:hypothetical protein